MYLLTIKILSCLSLVALDGQGQECEARGDLDQALQCYAAGMAENPAFYDTRFALRDDRLDLLEERISARRPLPEGPQLTPNSPKGSSVYVFAEEGFGDTIQFCRYLECLADYEVIFQPQGALKSLMEASFPHITIVDEPPTDYDYWIPLLSLPHFSSPTIEKTPGKAGYLRTAPLKVGIVWQGFVGRFNDAHRSLELEMLKQLKRPGIQLYSLQVGPGLEQLDDPEIIDLGSTFTDFLDTAEALKSLDVLVSIDTSVAHLGGALGVPTYILVPYTPDWRWFSQGEHTFWYDSVTLVRQSDPDRWDDCIDWVGDELAKTTSLP